MSDRTGIEWTDATWNPIRGCSLVSEGRRNCYAMKVAARFDKPGLPYEGLTRAGKWNGQVKLIEDHLLDPLKWKKPRKIFVNSMSDLFHENVPDEWIDRIFAVMALAPQHTFQVLTKRPERMREYFDALSVSIEKVGEIEHEEYFITNALDDNEDLSPPALREAASQWIDKWNARHLGWPLPNVWLGVSVENQKAADERIPLLLQTPAAVRFLSCEPLLGPVDLWNEPEGAWSKRAFLHRHMDTVNDVVVQQRIDWVIAGGESGPEARPMHPAWARSIRDQCAAAGVPFFFKQWGTALIDQSLVSVCDECNRDSLPEGRDKDCGYCGAISTYRLEMRECPGVSCRYDKKLTGRVLDGRTHDEFPRTAILNS